jgi:hypothetical protein
VKKTLLLALVITFALAACNRKAFVKKITGTWKADKYFFEGHDKTLLYDTTYRNYTLNISEDERYAVNYLQYIFAKDSLILSDTLGYDTPTMAYLINFDTLRFVDTTIVPHADMGQWDLINSEEDLQLRSDSDLTNPSIYRILTLDKSNLKLRKGNEEFDYKK